MNFEIYKQLVEKYYQKDCREINFQNRILIPFLEEIVRDKYDVVDSSTLYKNWKKINRKAFASHYTPDILVIKDWDLFKKKNKPILIIEVKSPTANDRKHAENEVKQYINYCKYAVLTDCLTWEIYENNGNIQKFYLDKEKNDVCEHISLSAKNDIKFDWIDSSIKENDWDGLCEKIKKIVEKKNIDISI